LIVRAISVFRYRTRARRSTCWNNAEFGEAYPRILNRRQREEEFDDGLIPDPV